MRVYNGTNSQVDLPLSGMQRISIASHSVSGDIMPSNEFLSLLVSSYDYSELALIVSGPFEITLCSSVSGCAGFVCQSLEEAIERFSKKPVESNPDPKVEKPKDKIATPENKTVEEKPKKENVVTEETKSAAKTSTKKEDKKEVKEEKTDK